MPRRPRRNLRNQLSQPVVASPRVIGGSLPAWTEHKAHHQSVNPFWVICGGGQGSNTYWLWEPDPPTGWPNTSTDYRGYIDGVNDLGVGGVDVPMTFGALRPYLFDTTYLAVQTTGSLDAYNWQVVALNQSSDPRRGQLQIGSLHQNIHSFGSGTPAGVAYDEYNNDFWWAWRDGTTINIYNNADNGAAQFAATTSGGSDGRLIYSSDKIYWGSQGVLSQWDANAGTVGEFVEVWSGETTSDLRPVFPSYVPGVWCWSADDNGTIMFFDPLIAEMVICDTGVELGHIYGGDLAGVLCYYKSGVQWWSTRTGVARENVYQSSHTDPPIDTAAIRADPNYFGYGVPEGGLWTPDNPVSPPAEGWNVVWQPQLGDHYAFTSSRILTQTMQGALTALPGAQFVGVGSNGGVGELSEPVHLELEEESTVYVQVSLDVLDSFFSSEQRSPSSTGAVLINGKWYGPASFKSYGYHKPTEGLQGYEPQQMRAGDHHFGSFQHAMTVNLPAGRHVIQGYVAQYDLAGTSLDPIMDVRSVVAVVEFDEDAEGYLACEMYHNSEFFDVAPIAASGDYLYLLKADTGGFTYGWADLNSDEIGGPYTQVMRIRLRTSGETQDQRDGFDAPYPNLIDTDEYMNLVAAPNDSMCTDGTYLFYAVGSNIYRANLALGAGSTIIGTAGGTVRGLAYHPVDSRLYFLQITGAGTGLYSMSTSGGVTLEQSISLSSNSGLYGNPAARDGSVWTGNSYTDRSSDDAAMRGQVGCTGDGAVWFRLISGNTYSMNRWSSSAGLVSVSSPNAWEIGANSVPVGDNAILSTAGAIQTDLGNAHEGRGVGCSTIRYWFEDGQIRREWAHVYYDMNHMDDFCFWAMDGTYSDGVLVAGYGTGKTASCTPVALSLIRVHDKPVEGEPDA